MQDEPQQQLFDKGEWWDEHWRDMPEFVQENLKPVQSVTVHFEKREDVEAFAKLVGQQITSKTQWIWYPEMPIESRTNRRWVDTDEK